MKKRFIYSLQYKIIVLALIFVILPLFIINLLTSNRYEKLYQNAMNDVTTRLAQQINNNIDTYFQKLNSISFMPYYNADIQNIMNTIFHEENPGIANDLHVFRMFNDFLFQMSLRDSNICLLSLFDLNGNLIAQKNTSGKYTDSDFFKPYLGDLGAREFRILPTHEQTYVDNSDYRVFSFIRLVKEVKTNTPIGYLVFDVRISCMKDIMKGIDSPYYSNVGIFNEKHEVIYRMVDDGSEEIFNISRLDKITKGNTQKIGETEYFFSFSVSEYTGFTTLISTDKETLIEDLIYLKIRNLLWISVLLVMVLVVTVLGTKKIMVPLQKLVHAMRSVGRGNFKAQVEIQTRDEIGVLSHSFNQMISYIDELIIMEYQAQLKMKDSELRALQSQINPHFLYNTLESIAMEAEVNGDTDVADMVSDLGNFFRYSVQNKSGFINIITEIEHIINYIAIQNVRFENRIRFSYSISEELRTFSIVKLLLQPIIENSIVHGFKNKTDSLNINLKTELVGEEVSISITDNGKGMSRTELMALKESICRADEDESNKIGLKNVQQRIQLIYGKEYKVHIKSSENSGTCIAFKIPVSQNPILDITSSE
ncbi:MAG: histidine kinase [Spirochaetales bacterium]|nr:histidine kinase [Spirochaetales bacterium]